MKWRLSHTQTANNQMLRGNEKITTKYNNAWTTSIFFVFLNCILVCCRKEKQFPILLALTPSSKGSENKKD